MRIKGKPSGGIDSANLMLLCSHHIKFVFVALGFLLVPHSRSGLPSGLRSCRCSSCSYSSAPGVHEYTLSSPLSSSPLTFSEFASPVLHIFTDPLVLCRRLSAFIFQLLFTQMNNRSRLLTGLSPHFLIYLPDSIYLPGKGELWWDLRLGKHLRVFTVFYFIFLTKSSVQLFNVFLLKCIDMKDSWAHICKAVTCLLSSVSLQLNYFRV